MERGFGCTPGLGRRPSGHGLATGSVCALLWIAAACGDGADPPVASEVLAQETATEPGKLALQAGDGWSSPRSPSSRAPTRDGTTTGGR